MDLKNQQEKFDDIKWYDSIVAGEDRCGSYDFCAFCDKSEPFPCANAAYRAQTQSELPAQEESKQKEWTRIATIRIRIGE